MKRSIKLIGEDKNRKLEITIKLTSKPGGCYDCYGETRERVNKDFELYIDKIVRELFMEEFNYHDIRG